MFIDIRHICVKNSTTFLTRKPSERMEMEWVSDLIKGDWTQQQKHKKKFVCKKCSLEVKCRAKKKYSVGCGAPNYNSIDKNSQRNRTKWTKRKKNRKYENIMTTTASEYLHEELIILFQFAFLIYASRERDVYASSSSAVSWAWCGA